MVYVFCDPSECDLVALDAWTGRPRWRRRSDQICAGHVAVADHLLYLAGEGGLFAVDEISGAARLVSPAYARRRCPAVGDGVVCIFSDQRLRAFEHPTGRPLWDREAEGAWPIIHAGVIYARVKRADDSSALLAFDLATGATRWEAPGWGHLTG